jgi:predicted DNA-binding WGR domain protein
MMQNFVQYGVKSAKGGIFWELSVVGASLIEREGKIGDKVKQKKTDCTDRPSAHALAEKLIAEKKAQSFILVPVKPLPELVVGKAATDRARKSAVHGPAPKEMLALEKQFHHICQHINEGYRDDLMDIFEPMFKTGAWAWVPVVEARPHEQIDRLGDVVMGPLYTCEAYPWPSRDGYPMAPLLQIDLARASLLGGIPLGDGLVQVWMPHKALAGEDQYVRVVPRVSVDHADLTPVQALPPDLEPMQTLIGDWNEELGRWLQAPAFQILTWGDKRYTSSLALGFQGHYTLKELTDSPALAKEIEAFDQALNTLVGMPTDPFSSVNTHLFGTFSEIQYAPQDCPQPLFCFDGGGFDLVWGDGANAQLFYDIDAEGVVTFTFDWSSL